MEKAAAYIRVSTDEQTEFSPSAQKRAIFEYASKNNIIINPNHIYIDEGISGRTAKKRPSFMKMISDAKKSPHPFDMILVHKLDRFSRSREDSVIYKSILKKECGIKVISITEPIENDKFSIILESILEAMAEYYSLNLSDEVKKGMFEKAHRGEHAGRAPFGYRLSDKHLIPIDSEAKSVQNMFNLFVNKNFSFSEICNYLNSKSITTKNNAFWRPSSLKYILSNPVYIGINRYNYIPRQKYKPNTLEKQILVNNSHPPIISESLFLKAQHKLNKSTKKHAINPNLCIMCHTCNTFLKAKKSGNGYISYFCPHCKNSISEIKIKKYISDFNDSSVICYNFLNKSFYENFTSVN